MKRYIISLFALLSMVCFTSCLTSGIDDPEKEFDGADITGGQIYYRWIDASGNVQQTRIARATDIDDEEQVFTILYAIQGALNEEQSQDFETLKKVVVTLDISTAAVIRPLGDSPKLGLPGDWSKPNQYEVTAANGTKKVWTVAVESYN
ncbi:MAG: DUF5018 domain-containing protein [Paramuribaculum sp.]|nr:hypothetical protein [Barnesiella sp.]MDE5821499.1 DUF5018 domain-containing protein [Paramuribaculum sp.]MDE5836406.1 DUF5018 domain-containing protein [Paramuribaculum sp.]